MTLIARPLVDRVCIGCGCTDTEACASTTHPGLGCYWHRLDIHAGVGVCSECKPHAARFDAGDRTPNLQLQKGA